jgi:hypothetical protein
MFSTLKARLLCGLSVAGFAMSLTTGSAVPVQAATIDFNTRGELANNFIKGLNLAIPQISIGNLKLAVLPAAR